MFFARYGEGELAIDRAYRDALAVGMMEIPDVAVDGFVVMPNHIHGIINVGAPFIAPYDAP